MECNVSRQSCSFRNKKQDCQVNGCFEVTLECFTAKLEKDPCEKILALDGKSYCSVYYKPPWLSKRLCPMVISKAIIQEERKVNPLKASKKAAKGAKS
jgi:hypothetical protein